MQKYKFLKPALVLVIITLMSAFLLSFVNFITADRIEKNNVQKKLEAIEMIFPSMSKFESVENPSYPSTVSDAGIVFDFDGNVLGYYAETSPTGLNGSISMIVGIDFDGTIVKTVCLSSSETPGFGTKATDNAYLEKFKDVKSVDAVDTISGATVSSKAVKLGISEACTAVSMLTEEK